MTETAARHTWWSVGLVWGASLILVGGLWPLMVRLHAANLWTQGVLMLALALLALAALRREGFTLGQVGASAGSLWRAAVVLAVAYALFWVALAALRAFGVQLEHVYKAVAWKPWLSDWVFIGGGEEFAFRGCMLVVLGRLLDRGRFPWRSVLLDSVLFALYHLPGELSYLQQGLIQPVDVIIGVAIPFVSALLVFCPLYFLSGNLWLVALVHGVTNYPILTPIKENPLLGLLFMVIVLVLGRFLLRAPVRFRAAPRSDLAA